MSVTLSQAIKSLGWMPEIQTSVLTGNWINKFHWSSARLPFPSTAGYTVNLPATNSGSLTVHDADNSTVATIARTDIHASVDYWGGFMYDSVESRLYCLGVDAGTSPYTYYIGYIDTTPSMNLLGGAIQPTSAFSGASTNTWATNFDTNGATSFWRAANGSGNFYIGTYYVSGQNFQTMQATALGVKATEPTDNPAKGAMLGFSSGDMAAMDGANGVPLLCIADGSFSYPDILLPYESGFSQSYQGRLLQWGDYVIQASYDEDILSGPRTWLAADVEAFVAAIKGFL